MITFSVKFNMRDGLVRQIRMSSNTQFSKLKRGLCVLVWDGPRRVWLVPGGDTGVGG